MVFIPIVKPHRQWRAAADVPASVRVTQNELIELLSSEIFRSHRAVPRSGSLRPADTTWRGSMHTDSSFSLSNSQRSLTRKGAAHRSVKPSSRTICLFLILFPCVAPNWVGKFFLPASTQPTNSFFASISIVCVVEPCQIHLGPQTQRPKRGKSSSSSFQGISA